MTKKEQKRLMVLSQVMVGELSRKQAAQAGGHLQRGEQGRGAMPLVLVAKSPQSLPRMLPPIGQTDTPRIKLSAKIL